MINREAAIPNCRMAASPIRKGQTVEDILTRSVMDTLRQMHAAYAEAREGVALDGPNNDKWIEYARARDFERSLRAAVDGLLRLAGGWWLPGEDRREALGTVMDYLNPTLWSFDEFLDILREEMARASYAPPVS